MTSSINFVKNALGTMPWLHFMHTIVY